MRKRLAEIASAALVASAGLGILIPVHAEPAPTDPYFPHDGTRGLDVRHYGIAVRYQPDKGRLQGRATLKIRATSDLHRVDLSLVLPATTVTADGKVARFTQSEGRLQVTLRRTWRRGTRHELVVDYAGRPARHRDDGERVWMIRGDEVVAIGEPHIAAWWFPANDHPIDPARYDISITAPRRLRAVSGGELVGTARHGDLATTHWRLREPAATYAVFFALGRFEIRSTSGDRPTVSAVSRTLSRHDRDAMWRLLRRTPSYVRWLESVLKVSYPFSALGGVVTGINTGFAMETQTRPVYPMLLDDAAPTVVHELAHQWFGDLARVRRWRDIWLNEGPATYLEQRWQASHGGVAMRTWLRETYADYRDNDGFWQLSIADPGPGQLFAWPVYLRGAMTLQALRNRIGARSFEALLTRWLRERRGRTGSTAQFIAMAEQVCDEDLGDFFDAWLRTGAAPAETSENGLG